MLNIQGLPEITPIIVAAAIIAAVWAFLSLVSTRNSKAQERLDRLNRPAGGGDLTLTKPAAGEAKYQSILDKAMALSKPLTPKTDLEQNKLKAKLANAGFRSEKAPSIFNGIRFLSLMVMATVGAVYVFLIRGSPHLDFRTIAPLGLSAGLGLYFPDVMLWWMRRGRQKQIFLTLPDILDLMVVCVESGLGLDAAMRKVHEEMKGHAPVIAEELAIANFQLQMGRPRREVLHDLGVRTGVDDVRSLAAILIQADRFGSSIAQALRVQSDSMRIRRRQLAEEKAAKTAVQLIFPLVLFIFPGVFVVLVGPAGIKITETMFK